MTRLVVLLSCLLSSSCASSHSPRNTAWEKEELASRATAWWSALRWGDLPEAAGAFEDDDARQAFLERWSLEPPIRIVDASVVAAEVSPPLEGASPLRTGLVKVKVEGYSLPSPQLRTALVEQRWYRIREGWYLEPSETTPSW